MQTRGASLREQNVTAASLEFRIFAERQKKRQESSSTAQRAGAGQREGMGKYRNGRRVAVRGGRAIFEKVENLVRGGAIPKPAWFDAMRECPPPKLPFSAPKPAQVVFPEDKLYSIYKRRNPDWDKEVIKLHLAARANGEKTRGYLFCNLWHKYILEGVPQEEAYMKVDAEFKIVEDKIKEEERKVLQEQIRSNKVPILQQRWEEEEQYVGEALDFHKKQWEARRAKRREQAEQLASS